MRSFYIHILLLISLVGFFSCKQDPLDGYVELEKVSKVGVLEDDSETSDVYEPVLLSESIEIKDEILQTDSIDLNPFKEYLNRKFMKDDVASRYFLDNVPGHVYKKENNNLFTRISTKRFVIDNKRPLVKLVDKEYYNDRVTDRKAINAAAKIINIGISKNQIMEMIIKDESTVYLPDSLIDIPRLDVSVRRTPSSTC